MEDTLKRIIEQEGDFKSGEYKGYEWEIRRAPGHGYLCGYIAMDHATPEQFEIMDKTFHGGVSWRFGEKPRNGKYGFDCGHLCDIVPRMPTLYVGAVYRDMAYVEDVLIRTIDMLMLLED